MKASHLIVVLLFALAPHAGCSELAQPEPPPTTPDRDFDEGSGIDARMLSAGQVENLVLLGRVWGFAKYHHPAVTSGGRNWDYDLFRVAPHVLEAPDRAAAASAIASWLAALGDVAECRPCAEPPAGAHLLPDNHWIADVAGLGQALSDRLAALHRSRPAGGSQYYVSLQPTIGNPDFSREATHARHATPDAGYRLLALYRFWNIIQYWFPYRDVIGEDWTDVLREFIPLVMQPMDGAAYRLAMIQLSARVHDTHANVWGELRLQPPTGSAQLPVVLRFVEGHAVVSGYSHAQLGPESGLRIGDVIEQIDGTPVAAMVEELRPYYSASNQPTRLRDIANKLTRGNGPAVVSGFGADGAFQRSVPRVPLAQLDGSVGRTHDLPGPAFRMLTGEVAYVKLSSVVAAEVGDYIAQALDARVLVIDSRNYPNAFVPFVLGGHLVGAATPFARFTVGSLSNPGAFHWGPTVEIVPRSPQFRGAVVILVDEVTQSSAEYHAMAFRASPNAIVVGSTTAGADGNVSRIPLPGGIESMISGIGVFYPDGSPTQRIGIIPDLEVLPTVVGIRAGRDEVLEAGVSRALGREFRLPQSRRAEGDVLAGSAQAAVRLDSAGWDQVNEGQGQRGGAGS